ncbi:FAD-binding oxidoreductase [Rhodococcus sp. HNM0569]|uniref:FAD-binding oxidoreductase n=1 Tax=Rhodococcus sp. HNM0569 TaxID=2716340 RepID=UPI00146CCDA0|nr:FAD-binding oxidoreductase [Rhodococcus sp. HNM0569]NLU83250.1 oxidoreductase [Rhodococcus sp. HNM0569]
MNIGALQASWRAVVGVGDEAIQYFYSHLFLSHPEVRSMFPVSMAQQRDRFFAALGHIVTNVESLASDPSYVEFLGRDHRRFDGVAEHDPAAGASLLATLEHFLGDAFTPELRADWTAAYQAVADIMIAAAAEAEKTSPPWWEGRVEAINRHSFDITKVLVRTDQPYPYRPGQSMAVEFPQRPRTWRFYTPANAPRGDDTLEIHIETVPGGQVSGAVARSLRPGDHIRLGAPVGNRLTVDPDTTGDLLMIAGGTGLAPLRAVVESIDEYWGTSGGAPNVYLFHGARYRANLYDHDYLSHLGSRPWFTYIPVVSDDPSFPGERGYVGTVAAEKYWWEGYTALVCGSPAMVDHAVGELTRVGMTPEAIRYEEQLPGHETDPTKPLEVHP